MDLNLSSFSMESAESVCWWFMDDIYNRFEIFDNNFWYQSVAVTGGF